MDYAGWWDWQKILNADFPPGPVPSAYAREPVPVVARVVWERDGEEYLDCLAIRWTRTHVLVDLTRTRGCSTIGPWLVARDVRRASASHRLRRLTAGPDRLLQMVRRILIAVRCRLWSSVHRPTTTGIATTIA